MDNFTSNSYLILKVFTYTHTWVISIFGALYCIRIAVMNQYEIMSFSVSNSCKRWSTALDLRTQWIIKKRKFHPVLWTILDELYVAIHSLFHMLLCKIWPSLKEIEARREENNTKIKIKINKRNVRFFSLENNIKWFVFYFGRSPLSSDNILPNNIELVKFVCHSSFMESQPLPYTLS